MNGGLKMSKGKLAVVVAAAVAFALVLGSLGVAWAAPKQAATAGSGLGLRLGIAARQAGATLADTVAKATGKPVADVRVERAAGASFASIASKAGVSADTIVSRTLARRKTLLDQAVKSGRTTQAQADAALDRMKTRLTERVDATGATACDGSGSGGGRGMGRGAGTGACGGCATSAATGQ
jgi:hypothetical protein